MEHNVSHFSLRSTADRVNVSVIAEKMGGGGHPAASGIQLEGACPQLPVKTYPNTSLSSEDVVYWPQTYRSYSRWYESNGWYSEGRVLRNCMAATKVHCAIKAQVPTYDRLTFKTLAGDVYDVGINIA